MTENFGEFNFISHFLRFSGYGSILDATEMLLLGPTFQITQDLFDLSNKIKPSLNTSLSTDKVFKQINEFISKISKIPNNNNFHFMNEYQNTLLVRRFNYLLLDTNIFNETDLNITIIQYKFPNLHYFLRSINNEETSKESSENRLIQVHIINTEIGILLKYPFSISLTFSLLTEKSLMKYLKKKLIEQLNFEDNNKSSLFKLSLYSSEENLNVNIQIKKYEVFKSYEVLENFIKSNKSIFPVIIYMKIILKNFHINSSQLTPYVLTLMIISFFKYFKHSQEFFTYLYYPYTIETIEPGYFLLSFLSFFSPQPQGQFNPIYMCMIPSHSEGIIYETHKDYNNNNNENNNDNSKELYWRVMDPVKKDYNVAEACELIYQSRSLFEHILFRLLKSYIKNSVMHFPSLTSYEIFFQMYQREGENNNNNNENNTETMYDRFSTIHNNLITILLPDYKKLRNQSKKS